MQREEALTVRGMSMLGRLTPGETLTASFGVYQCSLPARGDLVLLEKGEQRLVKQVLVMPGDNARVAGSSLVVNERVLEVLPGQPLVLDMHARRLLETVLVGPVPNDAYLVFSTRATDGFDSRRFAYVSRAELLARLSPRR